MVIRLGLAAFAVSAYIKTVLCPSLSSYTPRMSSASLVCAPPLGLLTSDLCRQICMRILLSLNNISKDSHQRHGARSCNQVVQTPSAVVSCSGYLTCA